MLAAPTTRFESPYDATFRAAAAYSPSTSLGVRVCLVLLGACIAVGTAGAIILGTSEESVEVPNAGLGLGSPKLASLSVPVPVASIAPVATAAETASAAAPSPVTLPDAVPASSSSLAIRAKRPLSKHPRPTLKRGALPPNPFDDAPRGRR